MIIIYKPPTVELFVKLARFGPWDDDSVYEIENFSFSFYGMAILSRKLLAPGYPKKNNVHIFEITIVKLNDYRKFTELVHGYLRTYPVT